MATGNAAGWRSTLAEVERAIADCLTALDRYEAAFGTVLRDEPGGAAPRPVPAADGAADRAWDEKLGAAERSADEVERLLAAQEAVWGRWRDALAEWRRLAAGATTEGQGG